MIDYRRCASGRQIFPAANRSGLTCFRLGPGLILFTVDVDVDTSDSLSLLGVDTTDRRTLRITSHYLSIN